MASPTDWISGDLKPCINVSTDYELAINEDGIWNSIKFIEWEMEIWEWVDENGFIFVVEFNSERINRRGIDYRSGSYSKGWPVSKEGYKKAKQYIKNQDKNKKKKTPDSVTYLDHEVLGLCKRVDGKEGARVCTMVEGCNVELESVTKYMNHVKLAHAQRFKELQRNHCGQ